MRDFLHGARHHRVHNGRPHRRGRGRDFFRHAFDFNGRVAHAAAIVDHQIRRVAQPQAGRVPRSLRARIVHVCERDHAHALFLGAQRRVHRDRVAAGNRMDQKYVARPHGLVVHDDPAIIRHALQLAGHGGWINVQAQPWCAHRIDHGQATCAVIQFQRQKARVAAAEGKDTVSTLYRLGKPVRGLLHGFRLRALHFIQHFAHRAKIPTNRVHRKSLLSVASPVHGSAHH